MYSVGDSVKFDQTSTKYFRISAVASTTLTLTAGASGVSVANAAISNIFVSKSATPQGMPLNGIPWWQELGRTTLGSAGDTISVTSIPARKYIRILMFATATGGSIGFQLRFNGDSGSNYTRRSSANGAADSSQTSSSSSSSGSTASNISFATIDVINIATSEKLLQGSVVDGGTAGAGNANNRLQWTGKWSNTSDQITQIDVVNSGTGDFAIGSEVVVLGHD